MVTGIRSLCGGLGPALFGMLFQIAQVPLDNNSKAHILGRDFLNPFPGAPFLVGTGCVLIALFVAMSAPDRLNRRGPSGSSALETKTATEMVELVSPFAAHSPATTENGKSWG